MRLALTPILLVPLAACVASEQPRADLRARQEAACAAVIAAHVGRPLGEVSSRWISEAGGVAQVEARDGNRLHICDVDTSGRVLGYSHPGT